MIGWPVFSPYSQAQFWSSLLCLLNESYNYSLIVNNILSILEIKPVMRKKTGEQLYTKLEDKTLITMLAFEFAAGLIPEDSVQDKQEVLQIAYNIVSCLEKYLEIGVWYDYCSLSQRPRTLEQQILFDQQLQYISDIGIIADLFVIITDCNNLENYFCRGWCLMEVLTRAVPISNMFKTYQGVIFEDYKSDFQSIPMELEKIKSYCKDNGFGSSFDISSSIGHHLTDIYFGLIKLPNYNRETLIKFANENSIKCTDGDDDIVFVFNLIIQNNIKFEDNN